MSFLKNENEKEAAVSKSDIITLIVIAVFGGGFWFYYQSAKKETEAAFLEADKLYQAKKLPQALAAYEKLEFLSYKDAQLDSLMYARTSELSDIKEQEELLYTFADSLDQVKDTVRLKSQISDFKNLDFLNKEQVEKVKSWRVRFQAQETQQLSRK